MAPVRVFHESSGWIYFFIHAFAAGISNGNLSRKKVSLGSRVTAYSDRYSHLQQLMLEFLQGISTKISLAANAAYLFPSTGG